MVMRAFACLILTIPLTAVAQDAGTPKKEVPKLETNMDKASYAIGFNIGKDLKRQGLELNPSVIAVGIAASMADEPSALTDAEIQEVFAALRAELQKKIAEKAAKNLEAGQAFLTANKEKEGVKVTKSGLQYKVLKEGNGKTPTTDSTVSTHYRGTLINGKTFDSSYEGDAPVEGEQPISFGVTQVIPGWTEALQLMKVGAKYRLFIPSELAYGENGPGEIGPNSVLIFDLELIDVKN
jgi:FKBP-type peptidyl-prolyl cis-trans isomerase FklB